MSNAINTISYFNFCQFEWQKKYLNNCCFNYKNNKRPLYYFVCLFCVFSQPGPVVWSYLDIYSLHLLYSSHSMDHIGCVYLLAKLYLCGLPLLDLGTTMCSPFCSQQGLIQWQAQRVPHAQLLARPNIHGRESRQKESEPSGTLKSRTVSYVEK